MTRVSSPLELFHYSLKGTCCLYPPRFYGNFSDTCEMRETSPQVCRRQPQTDETTRQKGGTNTSSQRSLNSIDSMRIKKALLFIKPLCDEVNCKQPHPLIVIQDKIINALKLKQVFKPSVSGTIPPYVFKGRCLYHSLSISRF